MGRYAGGSSHTLHSTPQLLPLPEGRCFHKALGLNRHSKTSGTPCFCKAKQSNFRPHSWGCSAPLRSAGLQSPAQGLPHTHGTPGRARDSPSRTRAASSEGPSRGRESQPQHRQPSSSDANKRRSAPLSQREERESKRAIPSFMVQMQLRYGAEAFR